ncbi:sensor histidine kinase [Streptomyces liangshanensis]|uniref:sensor histidine kinase n=1 Tax=Streptomyces liangshanensis TaxID=2717324 RepID=UPI0036DC1713
MTTEQTLTAPGQDWSVGARPLTRRIKHVTERVRAYDNHHPRAWDLVLTASLVTAALVDLTSRVQPTTLPALRLHAPVWLALTLSLGFTVPLLWRRREPRGALLAVIPFSLLNGWSDAGLQALFLQLVIIFNVALRLPLRTLAWSCALVVASLWTGDWDRDVVPMLNGLAFTVLLGLAVRTRQEYTAALLERARQLEVERDQQAQLAAAAERTRIAREMHDIIGHNLSVITGLADGGSYAAARNPRRAVEALDAIGTTSRQALTELRRLLEVLREEETGQAELAPQPALTDLARLVGGVRAAGLPVHLTTEGRADALPPGRQLTVYRVIQEALTNTLKHAGPGATASVHLSYAADGVTVTVTDTGGTRGRVRAAHSPPPGRGLTGMRERTALYDGTLEAGPLDRPSDGWQVRLHLTKGTDKP